MENNPKIDPSSIGGPHHVCGMHCDGQDRGGGCDVQDKYYGMKYPYGPSGPSGTCCPPGELGRRGLPGGNLALSVGTLLTYIHELEDRVQALESVPNSFSESEVTTNIRRNPLITSLFSISERIENDDLKRELLSITERVSKALQRKVPDSNAEFVGLKYEILCIAQKSSPSCVWCEHGQNLLENVSGQINHLIWDEIRGHWSYRICKTILRPSVMNTY